MTTIAFLDIEASALDDGFPIEVGVALINDDETLEPGPAESWLIKPSSDWEDGAWDPLAEDLHGISREILERDGLSPWTVAERLSAALADVSVVYSDAPSRDGGWLSVLFEQSPLTLSVSLMGYNGLLRAVLGGRERAQAILREARAAAARQHPVQHRALPDALKLRETFLYAARAARGGGDVG